MTSSTDTGNHHSPNQFYYYDDQPVVVTAGESSNNKRRALPATFETVTKQTHKRPLLSTEFDSQTTPIMMSPQQGSDLWNDHEVLDLPSSYQSFYQSGLQFEPDPLDSSPTTCIPITPIEMKIYPIKGVPVQFPFKPYPAQIQMMAKIIEALQKEQHAVLESPTGSGKSLALLCGALAWVEKEREARAKEQNERLVSKKGKSKIETSNKIKSKNTSHINITSNMDMDDDEFFDYMDLDPLDALNALEDVETLHVPKPLPRIYVGSRTHKQVSQLVNELKGRTPYRPTEMTVLGSREQYCIHDKVSMSDNKTEDCANLTETRSCSLHNNTETLVDDPRIQRGGSMEVWDIEDLNILGRQVGGCPYYASRNIAETAELIICPYNYLIDPIIRNVMNIDTTGNIIILDEAHNVESASRDAGTFEVDDTILSVVGAELRQIIENGFVIPAHQGLLDFLGYMLTWMHEPSHKFDIQEDSQELRVLLPGDEIKRVLEDYLGIKNEILAGPLNDMLDLAYRHAESQRAKKKKEETDEEADEETDHHHARSHLSVASLAMFEKLFMVLGFILDPTRNFDQDYNMVLMKNTSKSVSERRWEVKLGLWCMNPAVIFQDIAQMAHSIILTSGTLTPVTTFEAELGIKFPITLEANHVIKSSQVLVQNIPYGPTMKSLKGVYATTSTTAYQDDVGEAIASICQAVPFGILVFVTSYAVLDKLHDRWEETGLLARIKSIKHVIKEPRTGSTESFNRTLKKFYNHIKRAESSTGSINGAMFLAVYRGKVSEGIDFNNNNCRAVVATGIPFPMWKDTKVRLKRTYNDGKSRQTHNALTGDQWYSIQAFRAINQALGRCIRHRNDWGAIILLEERFLDHRNLNNLSKWIQRLCVSRTDSFTTIMNDLAEFTKQRQAIDLEEMIAMQHVKDEVDTQQEGEDTIMRGDTALNSETGYNEDTKNPALEQQYLQLDQQREHDIQYEHEHQQEREHQREHDIQYEYEHQGEHKHQQEHEHQGEHEHQQEHKHQGEHEHQQQLDQKQIQKQQSLLYVVSCRRCDYKIMTAPFQPFAFKSKSAHLHYFYDVAQQEMSHDPLAVLEIDPAKSLWKPWDGNGYIQPKTTTTKILKDAHWDTLDNIVYQPFLNPCCSQTIGAYIIATTTSESSDSNRLLIGKLWLLKHLVQVSLV